MQKLILVFTILALMLCGCSLNESDVLQKNSSQIEKTEAKPSEYSKESSISYSISVYDPACYSEYGYLDGKETSFLCVEMENKDLEGKINDTVLDASASWISGDVINFKEFYGPDILCHNSRYLCFGYSLEFASNRYDYVDSFVTVDMQTGDQVYLNDLVNVDELAEYLCTDYECSDWFDSFTADEIKEKLYECSLTQKDILDKTHCLSDLIFKWSFYMKPGTLGIWAGGITVEGFEIDLSEINELLKVEPW